MSSSLNQIKKEVPEGDEACGSSASEQQTSSSNQRFTPPSENRSRSRSHSKNRSHSIIVTGSKIRIRSRSSSRKVAVDITGSGRQTNVRVRSRSRRRRSGNRRRSASRGASTNRAQDELENGTEYVTVFESSYPEPVDSFSIVDDAIYQTNTQTGEEELIFNFQRVLNDPEAAPNLFE